MKKNKTAVSGQHSAFSIQRLVIGMLVLLCVSACAFGSSDANSYRELPITGYSVTQGMATRITGNVADRLMGRFYGILYDVDFYFVGTDSDGITLTVYELPIMVGTDLSWPAAGKISKFTYTFTSATNPAHIAPETTTINSNAALGALFTGGVYITVTGVAETVTAIYINLIYDEQIRPYRN
jgi:hypothetical protein